MRSFFTTVGCGAPEPPRSRWGLSTTLGSRAVNHTHSTDVPPRARPVRGAGSGSLSGLISRSVGTMGVIPRHRDSTCSSDQALEVEREHLQRAMGPLDVSPEALARELEPEKECLLDRDLRLASFNGGSTPWNHLLTLYKQLQKSAMAKFPLMEDLPHEEEEEETKEEDSSLGLCVPGTAGLQSPLQKSFSPTDTVGFVQSELKNLLAVQRESRLWKVGSQEGRELLAQPEITLQEAGVVDGQHLLLEEMDEMGNWPPE